MRGLGKVCGLAALVSAFLSSDLHAQDQRNLTQAEQKDWPAIGLVFYGALPKGAICTGTLVAPDLVLTAGHCVKENSDMATLHFAAGWRDGVAIAMRAARGVVLAETAAGAARTLADDLALIILDRPIPEGEITPLPLSKANILAEGYSFFGYRRDLPGFLGRDDTCELAGLPQGTLLLKCVAISGNSGGPLLIRQSGRWVLAAVMVARAKGGQAQSYAVMPNDALRRRIAAP